MHVAWRQCPGIEALTWKFACFLAFHFSQIFLNRPGSAMWNFCKVLKCFGSANWWNGARRFKTTVKIKCIFSPAGTIQRPVLARCLMGWMEAVLQWKSFSSIEFTCRAKPKRRTMDWPCCPMWLFSILAWDDCPSLTIGRFGHGRWDERVMAPNGIK